MKNKIVFELETDEVYNDSEIKQIDSIFKALITTGGLLGVKNGSTQLHFDAQGNFMRIKLEYFPWKRRK